eukprot:3088080-Pyramimonas_sp.AAC.1
MSARVCINGWRALSQRTAALAYAGPPRAARPYFAPARPGSCWVALRRAPGRQTMLSSSLVMAVKIPVSGLSNTDQRTVRPSIPTQPSVLGEPTAMRRVCPGLRAVTWSGARPA